MQFTGTQKYESYLWVVNIESKESDRMLRKQKKLHTQMQIFEETYIDFCLIQYN